MNRAPDAWPTLGEELVAGFCHEMNGRLNALRGTLDLARLDGQVDEAVGDELATELERLERAVRLLRHLGAERDPEPEPIRPVELLPLAASLLRHHRELATIEVEVVEVGDTPAVLAPWSRLLRLLTLLLAGAAAEAARREGHGGVRAEVRVDGDGVVVGVGGAGGEAGAGERTERPDEPSGNSKKPGRPKEAPVPTGAAAAPPGAGAGAGTRTFTGTGGGGAVAGAGGAASAGPARPLLVTTDAVGAAAAMLGGTLVGGGGAAGWLAVRLPAWRQEES